MVNRSVETSRICGLKSVNQPHPCLQLLKFLRILLNPICVCACMCACLSHSVFSNIYSVTNLKG